MAIDARQPLGRLGEDLATAHLERLGYTVLDRNFRTRLGELDIVAARDGVLIFCEVKTRRAGGGEPWWSLRRDKQQQVRRMAIAWLNAAPRRVAEEIRFDAIGVIVDDADALLELKHEEDAF